MDWVFGYASLVALREQVVAGGEERAPVPGRLRGWRRLWGVAMDNWDPVNDRKHFLDPETGERPRIRVAYLDVEPAGDEEAAAVNGLALPVDATRLAAFDRREVNYERVEVTSAFEPDSSAAPGAPSRLGRVFTYVGTAAARERCRRGAAEGNACVSAAYVAAIRDAFASLAPDAPAELDRSTDPLPFPERPLRRAPR